MATANPVSMRSALVVRPDPAIQQGLCRILEGLGLSPTIARSAEELEALTASRGPFSLTVVDAERQGGEVLEALRRSRVRQGDPGPLIVLAHRAPSRASKADLGADQVLLAPW